MSLGDDLRPHLPFLRRYARALTGSQQHGDAFVRATLEAIVAAPDQLPRSVDPRLGQPTLALKLKDVDLGGGIGPRRILSLGLNLVVGLRIESSRESEAALHVAQAGFLRGPCHARFFGECGAGLPSGGP